MKTLKPLNQSKEAGGRRRSEKHRMDSNSTYLREKRGKTEKYSNQRFELREGGQVRSRTVPLSCDVKSKGIKVTHALRTVGRWEKLRYLYFRSFFMYIPLKSIAILKIPLYRSPTPSVLIHYSNGY
jgi:hypothetical protein